MNQFRFRSIKDSSLNTRIKFMRKNKTKIKTTKCDRRGEFPRAREKLTCDISFGSVCVCACAWLLCPVEDRSLLGRCCCCWPASDLRSCLHLSTPIITGCCTLDCVQKPSLLTAAYPFNVRTLGGGTSSISTLRPNLTRVSCCTLRERLLRWSSKR